MDSSSSSSSSSPLPVSRSKSDDYVAHDWNSTLHQAYYGQAVNEGINSGAFSGLSYFWTAIHKKYPRIPFAAVRRFYKSQAVTQMHKPKRRPKLFRHFLCSGPKQIMGIDAMFLPKAGRGLNKYYYAYIAQDAFSRLAAIWFTSKLTGANAIKAVTYFVRTLNFPSSSWTLYSDLGSDFQSLIFSEFTGANKIRHVNSSPASPHHVAQVERLIRMSHTTN